MQVLRYVQRSLIAEIVYALLSGDKSESLGDIS
jgi:hypothetical protein